MQRLAILAATIAGLTATAPPAQFVDPDHRFTFAFSDPCEARPRSGDTAPYVQCGHGYVRAIFAPGGSDKPALQRVVNTITVDWSNIKVLVNKVGPNLGSRSARFIFAESNEGPRGTLIDAELLAVPKDGGWYVLVFVLPANEWTAKAIGYFQPIKTSFRFTQP